MKTIEQLLGYVYLTGLIQAIKTGIPKVLPEGFWTISSDTLADQGRYTRVTGTRKLARRVEYGAPALRRELKDIGVFDVKLIHLFEHLDIDVKTYQSLRNYTDYNVQRMGQQELDRQAMEFRTLFDNAGVAAVHSMLAKGKIWFDSKGNVLPTATGAATTIDFGVKAAHQGQLNNGVETIIAASWAVATTDIPLHLRKIRQRGLEETGYEPTTCYYGINMPGYLQTNNFVKDWFVRYPAMRDKFMDTNEIPDGMIGWKWVPAYKTFFNDQNDATQRFFGVDDAVFTPDLDMSWYEFMRGTYPCPKRYGVSPDLQGAVGQFEIVTDMFGYGVPTFNPMAAQFFAGRTFLPVLKNPDVIFQADVTP